MEPRDFLQPDALSARSLLARQPVFIPPRGFDAIGYLRPNDDLSKAKGLPVPGFGYYQFHFIHRTKKTGKPVRIIATTDEIYLAINDPERALDVYMRSELKGRMFYEPERIGESAGYPIYRLASGNDLIVLTRGGASPIGADAVLD